MLIKNIFIELRSRLRSCNVFITTGIDFSKNCNLKISIQSNCIVLNYYNNDDSKLKRRDSLSSIESLSDCYSTEEESDDVTTVILIGDFCKIIPNSMSCLKIDKSTVSFRILTEPKNGGNFYTELLSTNTIENTKKSNDLKINVRTNEELKINCANCSNVISDNFVTFERILELPSANLDISEWFCHGHSHSHGHGDDVPQNDLVLKPSKKDFLYRLTFFVVNSSLLSDKTNKFNVKREVYHCNRCLAWLGLKNKDGTVKLFDSEVKINQNGTQNTVFSHKNPSDDVRTDDFIYTIEYMTKEFSLGFQYTIMCKIVLECTVSSSEKQYLLIWVMDKELQVLKNIELIDNEKIKLSSNSVMKILYKIEMSLNEEVEAWLTDPAVASTEISKNMFSKGLEHFQNMSLKVPEAFRNTNGYFVTYLKV